jgi:predicted dinucleotide-binding enzyme
MKIAILGTGPVGQTLSEKLAQLGHQLTMGTTNVENSLARTGNDSFGRPPLKEWHKKNQKIKLGTYAQAAAFGEFIVNATNGAGSLNALDRAGKENLSGKILLDISNPLDF